MKSIKLVAYSCLILCLPIGSAYAAEIEYALRFGAAYSDNIGRGGSGSEQSASSAAVGFELDGLKETGRLRYELQADVTRFEYLSADLDAEIFGRANLLGSYELFQDLLSWHAGIAYDQIREDIFRPLAPGNVDEQINYTTGPSLRLRMASSVEAQIDARYNRLDYASARLDSETLGIRGLLIRRGNPRSFLGVGGAYDDVKYLPDVGTSLLDFRRSEPKSPSRAWKSRIFAHQ
jgi:hypothetical protein